METLGAYIRVSSTLQSENDSVANQRARAADIAKRLGCTIKLYEDVESGGKATRSAWTRLKNDIENKKVSVVWANENDRLGRNLREAATFWDLCQSSECRLFVGKDEVDFNNDSDFLQYGFASLISESDRRKIIRKTRETKAVVINDGRNTYRQIYGYDCEVIGAERGRPKRRWFPVDTEVEAIKKIYHWYLVDKMPVKRICNRLNDAGYRAKNGGYFLHLSVYHILHQIVYTGYTLNKAGERIPSKIYTLPIISLEDYDEVQKRWKPQTSDKSFTVGRPVSHLASGLLKCGQCGTGYFFHANKPPNGHAYYHNNSKDCERQKNKTLSYQVINWHFDNIYLWAMLEDVKDIYARLKADVDSERDELSAAIENLKTQISDVDKKIKRLINAIEKDDDEDLGDRLRQRRQEKKELQAKLDSLSANIAAEEKKLSSIVAAFSADNVQLYLGADEPDKMRMLKQIVKTATINDGIITTELIDGRIDKSDYQELKKDFRAERKENRIAEAKMTRETTLPIARTIEALAKADVAAKVDGKSLGDVDAWFEILDRAIDSQPLTTAEQSILTMLIQTYGQ